MIGKNRKIGYVHSTICVHATQRQQKHSGVVLLGRDFSRGSLESAADRLYPLADKGGV